MNNETFPTPELVQLPEQHLAVVRATVAMDEIPALYDNGYPAIFAALARAGVQPVAAPMGVTHGEPGEKLDLGAAVPVAEPIVADGDVRPEVIPAGRAATLLVKGDYGQIPDAYAYLFSWIADQSLKLRGIAWEQYLTEPEPGGDPALNETLLGALVE